MNKKNLLLTTLLIIQLVLIALALRPQKTVSGEEHLFLAGMTADTIVSLNINDGDKQLSLDKQDESWLVKGDGEYPADGEKIKGLLDKLIPLSSKRMVASTKASQLRLKVADNNFNRKLTVTDKDGKKVTLFLGSSPSYKSLHVRLAGDDGIYLVNDLSIWEMQVGKESWWATKYIDLRENELAKVSLTNSNGSFSLVRTDSKWTIEGDDRLLQDDAVQEFLDKATHINLLSYLGKDKPDTMETVATVVLETQSKSIVSLAIGPKNKEENNHIVKADSSPYYVSVAGFSVERLLDKTAESFLAAVAPPPANTQQKK